MCYNRGVAIRSPTTTARDGHASADASWQPAGRARFSGWVILAHGERTDVARLLPSRVQLAPPDGEQRDHPLVFVFGDVADGTVLLGGVPAPTGRRFREFGIYVPDVRNPGEITDHLYAARIWCSYQVSCWSGKFHYGFAKELGLMWWQDKVFLVTDASGALVAHAEVESSAAQATRSDAFARVRSMFMQPVLGHRPDARPVRSRFRWRLEAPSLQRGTGAVSLAPQAVGTGALRFASQPGCAVRIDALTWEVGWPTA
jgi:hypothetical protein